MSSKFRLAALIINLLFIGLLVFAIFFREAKYPAALLLFLVIFLVLFFSQCFVWNIKPAKGGFILYRIFLQRFKLTYSDILDIDVVYMAYRLSGSEKNDETLKLTTTKGNFRFRAGDYMQFTEVTALLFGTPDLQNKYYARRALAAKKTDPFWKLKDYLVYLTLALLIAGFIALLKSR